MREVDVLIIGAGPAGLSLAHHLSADCLIVEREREVGGLCRSIEREGAVFDIGGHSFHTPHPEVRQFVERIMGDNWESQIRDARVFSHGVMLPYPFQKHFDQIPDQEVVEACRAGLAQADSAEDAENFQEYIIRRFGPGVAEHFMLPYNRKIWARDIRRVSCEWTSQRVAAPKGREEQFDTKGGERKPLQAGTMVSYPKRGGFQAIFVAMAGHVPALELGQEVVEIDPVRKVAKTAAGMEIGWNRLVSTMPIPELLKITSGIPEELRELADTLEFMSLSMLIMTVSDPLPDAPQRIYSADPEVPPSQDRLQPHVVHRASSPAGARDHGRDLLLRREASSVEERARGSYDPVPGGGREGDPLGVGRDLDRPHRREVRLPGVYPREARDPGPHPRPPGSNGHHDHRPVRWVGLRQFGQVHQHGHRTCAGPRSARPRFPRPLGR